MNVNIYQLVEGAKSARGLTVVIDVFRAFSLEAYLLANGAEKTIPVGDVNLAYKLKQENPDYLLAGERHGKILPGFDIGNSPAQAMEISVLGKTVIHTTSAGTQGIANAVNASEILGASLVNAKATAEYIKSIIENKPFDIESKVENLKYTTGAKFFDPQQNDVFPMGDFPLCTNVNCFDFVMKLVKTENGPSYIKKVEL